MAPLYYCTVPYTLRMHDVTTVYRVGTFSTVHQVRHQFHTETLELKRTCNPNDYHPKSPKDIMCERSNSVLFQRDPHLLIQPGRPCPRVEQSLSRTRSLYSHPNYVAYACAGQPTSRVAFSVEHHK